MKQKMIFHWGKASFFTR